MHFERVANKERFAMTKIKEIKESLNKKYYERFEIKKRMERDGVTKIFYTYKIWEVGKRVLCYDRELGEFSHLTSVDNNPHLTVTRKLRFHEGMDILEKLAKGEYTLVSAIFIKDVQEIPAVRYAEAVRKEVILNA